MTAHLVDSHAVPRLSQLGAVHIHTSPPREEPAARLAARLAAARRECDWAGVMDAAPALRDSGVVVRGEAPVEVRPTVGVRVRVRVRVRARVRVKVRARVRARVRVRVRVVGEAAVEAGLLLDRAVDKLEKGLG